LHLPGFLVAEVEAGVFELGCKRGQFLIERARNRDGIARILYLEVFALAERSDFPPCWARVLGGFNGTVCPTEDPGKSANPATQRW